MPTGFYPAFLMVATAAVWVFTARQSHILIQTFWERLPRVAERELDNVIGRSARNAVFPFRRRAAEVFRGDNVLWRLRRRFLFWSALSVLVPILGFLGIGIFALIVSQR